ncbi:hypothetical protein [Solemya elarraichensis gill symbiont]|uniref:Uncharacterized protein n=1 Tax=Solemya elarraichensis gill symbiont TaxID=1918949 RepID=A0A1T2KYM2_9GAMM|nr:hypothetical protein [Solemya elarraichensis gill symbiont]OOZ37933.1 hypothetical protein BOW52_09920 [Solemya elarraichensis gill symbiont]
MTEESENSKMNNDFKMFVFMAIIVGVVGWLYVGDRYTITPKKTDYEVRHENAATTTAHMDYDLCVQMAKVQKELGHKTADCDDIYDHHGVDQ